MAAVSMKFNTLSIPLILGSSVSAFAASAGGIDVHGSVSATASYSDEYNFYGDTEGRLDLNIVEAVVNGTKQLKNGMRVGAQIYAYKLADANDLVLDWANVDYSFKPYFGVRAGRNKLPMGLYNDSQDVDSIRIFASLPLAFYPRYFRPITASFDGVSLYGSVSLGKAGSVDYQVFGGFGEDVDADTYFLRYFSSWSKYTKWEVEKMAGTQIFWNLPVDGLKLGVSLLKYFETNLRGYADYTAHLTGRDLAFAQMIGPGGVWDAFIAGKPIESRDLDIVFRTFSAEYTYGDLTLAAEYKKISVDGYNYAPVLGQMGTTREAVQRLLFWYASASYQINEKFGVGTYYSFRDDDYNSDPVSEKWREESHDYAIAGSFSPNENWIFKAEFHWNDGISLLYDTTKGDPLPERKWNLVVLKATFSF